MPGPLPKTISERLYAQMEPDTNGGCWLWTGVTASNGYGRFGIGPPWKSIAAHRAMWELHRGSIPKGLHCCHKCDVRACVNPDHIFLGTRRDNMRDMARKGRGNPARGTAHRSAKLTDSQVRDIREAKKNGRTQRSVAADYGTSHATIGQIWRRSSWAHVA